MTSDNKAPTPNLEFETTTGLMDYFCPFCGQKLFRGKVSRLNMVCSNCNKLVRSKDLQGNLSDEKLSDEE